MVSIEDPFDQDDWDGYRPFTAAVGEKAGVCHPSVPVVQNRQGVNTTS